MESSGLSIKGALACQRLAIQGASQLWKILSASSISLNTWHKSLSVSILAASFCMAASSSSSSSNELKSTKGDDGKWRMAVNDQWQDSAMTEKHQIMGCCCINSQLFKCLPLSSTFLSLLLLFLIFLSASFCLTIIEIQRRKLMNKQKKQQIWNRRWKRQNETCIQDRQKCPQLLRWGRTRVGQKMKVVLPWAVCLWAEQEDEEERGCGEGMYRTWSRLCAWMPSAARKWDWNRTRATVKIWCDSFLWLLLGFL